MKVDNTYELIIVDGKVLTQVPYPYSSYYADIENGILYSARTGNELKRIDCYERPGKHNYVTTTLTDDYGISKCMGVHEVIVAAREGWEWKTLHKLEIDHINEEKSDNRGVNLQLKTHAEQYTDSVRLKMSLSKRGTNHHNAKLDENDVLEIRQRFNEWDGTRKEFVESVADEFGVTVSAINAVLYGYTWNHI